MCNGNHNNVKRFRKEIIENRLYELFRVDGYCAYYGSFRCIKMVTMDWTEFMSLGQEVSSRIRYPSRLVFLTSLRVYGGLFGHRRSTGRPCGSCRSITHEEHVQDRRPEGQLRGITVRGVRRADRRGNANGKSRDQGWFGSFSAPFYPPVYNRW